MMRKKGFTIMELLLVVATVAIVAAAVAPTFTEGVAEALEESRKSTMKSAYLNAVFGANLMMSVLLPRSEKTYNYKPDDRNKNIYSNQLLPVGLSLDAGNQWKTGNFALDGSANFDRIHKTNEVRNLNYYVPVERRVFSNLKGKEYFISAKIGTHKEVVIYYVDVSINGWDKQSGLKDYTGAAMDKNKINLKENHEIMSGNPQAFKSLDALWEKIKNESPKK